jgi:uncharacterized protein YabE (DUF348 family)
MHAILRFMQSNRTSLLTLTMVLFVVSFFLMGHVSAANDDKAKNGRLITIHDRGQEKVILTHARTISDALAESNITVSSKDIVEPGLESTLVATDYTVNIYRARPVVVVDGMVRQKIMTAAQTPQDIAKAANVSLRLEDKTKMTSSANIALDGASTVLTIDRASKITVQLYGTTNEVYSHAQTVGEMLAGKGVKLSPEDTVTPGVDTPISELMTITVWREGVQTATVEEAVSYPVRKIQNADQPIGYHEIQTPGKDGRKSVTYEITAANGKEVSRKAIQSVIIQQPTEQVEIIGIKPGPNSLTKSKGAQVFVDSKGVAHRETYYDLPMNIVMRACGGGSYSIRADGAKIDKDGYILIAAHLGNYPRCSIVETSMGLGKVYDTGGFTAKHPHGFDLATDWTKADGI